MEFVPQIGHGLLEHSNCVFSECTSVINLYSVCKTGQTNLSVTEEDE